MLNFLIHMLHIHQGFMPARNAMLQCVVAGYYKLGVPFLCYVQSGHPHHLIALDWTSLMLMMTTLFAILFIFLAIISEYIGRTLIESKNRPLYYVAEEYTSITDKSRASLV